MASYLTFYLDLEANGEIIVPLYTTTDSTTYIRVVSEVELAEIYDIKIVNALGIEYNYPSLYPDTKDYTFEFVFTDFPLGETTFYASIRDKIGNSVVLTPKTFEILKVSVLLVAISDTNEHRPLLSDSPTCKVLLSDEGIKH